MSRTYRRMDDYGRHETKEILDLHLGRWVRQGLSRREAAAKAHADGSAGRFVYKSPSKYWRRMSHKARRAIERRELHNILKDPDHDFNVDLYNEAHRLSLWDWY